ncbi:MAG: DUF86 domain-containing protein [Gammaproteobacteria bacterium]|nr:DUF86 domain-containing protein [Gammaproteobacteria bacterium]
MQQRHPRPRITNVICAAFPETQAIYRFGSWGTDAERIRQTWSKPSDLAFDMDFDKQDVITLNLQRLFESLTDMCKHLVRERRLGLPKDNAHAIELLAQASLIDEAATKLLKGWNGMRNIIVHRYRSVDLEKLAAVVENDIAPIVDTARSLARREARS